ncbi:MAG: toxin-antitoxin system HicB family antitoxin [Acidobacteriota bacterium]|jgi:predicted transcriptional regulator|nr:ribbon-helix-helix protein, CopG family [Acidobacteriota bacterium]MDQ3374457.1 toxin-antitoxin system HicB family antitoxin [Acidobacteriota bacterium]
MSAITVELPNSLHRKLEELAEKEGISLSQFLATAAAEKMSALETFENILREAKKRDTRKAFETFLRAVPDIEPENPDDIIK